MKTKILSCILCFFMIKAIGQNCNSIINGSFESGAACGIMPPVAGLHGTMNNWQSQSGTPDIFSVNPCGDMIFETSSGTTYGSNAGTIVGVPTGNTGNFIVGLLSSTNGENEAIRQTMTAALVNGQAYSISFSAKLGNSSPLYSGGNISGNLAFYSSNTIPTANSSVNLNQTPGLTPLTNIGVNTAPYDIKNPWRTYTTTFVYTGGAGQNILYIAPQPIAGQDGNYIYLDDISLVEIPNLSATNTTICAGNSINLTATYSNTTATYSWSGPNGFTSNLQNPIIPNATTASSGTYICTVNTSNPNCSTTASITVTVTQPPIPTVSNVNYCVNSTPTPLTATGLTGATFNWLPSNIPNVSTVGTFNYTVSQTVNGCTSNTATLIVTVTPCNPCLANYATPVTTITGGTTQILTGNQTFSNANYFIANDITIDGNITFTDAEVLVADGVQITVAEGAVFNILGSHFYGCQQMWKGIKAATQTAIVNLDKSPTTYKSNLIEDAIIAIDMSSITGAVSYRNDHFALSASNTIFNKNNTSIKVSNYISSQPATYSVTRNPIWIQRNIFTSRNMPFSYGGFNWPNYSDIAALKDASNNNGFDIAPQTLASPYIIDAIYDPNISNAFLKTPYLNKKPECGIMLLNNGDALSSINSIAINLGRQLGAEEDVIAPTSNSLNLLFDNLCFGVKIKNSFVSIIGAVFQQPVLNAIGVQVNDNASKLVNIGYDSYMFGNFTGLNSYMVNGFYNLKYGIVSSNSYNVNISGNVFRGGNGNTDFGYKTIRAINLSCNNFKQLSVVGNECTNVSTGVYISNGSTDGSNIGNTGEINVSYNYLQAYHPNITPQGNENLRQAIYIGGTSLKSTTQQNLAKTINCLNNTLTGVVNGIQMLNIIGKRFVVKDNIITLANLQGASSSTTGFGISVGGCSPVWDRNNIENNIISGNDLDQSKQTGIFINNNARTNVQCNNVAGLTHGFRFYKTCLFTRFFDNVMDPSNLYGFTLENGGRITPQGKPTDTRNGIYGCTSNNNWYCGTSGWEFLYYPTPHFKTYCDNSIATSSPFLVGNVDPNSALSPDNGTNSPSAIYPQYGVAGSLEQVPNFSATTGDCMRCTFTNPVVLGGRTISNEDLQAQESIADGSIELVSSDEAMELYTLQQQLYEQLQEQDLSITNSTILNNFVQSHIWSSFDYIYYITKYMSREDWATVDFLLDYFPVENDVDENYYKYFNWLYDYNQGNIEAINIADVLALAEKCPATSGNVVFAAQDFYNRLTGEIHYFENNCPTGTMSRKAKPVIIPKAKPTAMPLCVFPNPASSNIRITGKQIQQVKIVDIWGKIILNNSYNNEAVMNINISKLPQGMYIVQAMQKDGIVLTNKLIKQ